MQFSGATEAGTKAGVICHVCPPSIEKYRTLVNVPPGSGVKADAALTEGFAGLTARLGSLSRLVSPLFDAGTMSTTLTCAVAKGPQAKSTIRNPEMRVHFCFRLGIRTSNLRNQVQSNGVRVTSPTA